MLHRKVGMSKLWKYYCTEYNGEGLRYISGMIKGRALERCVPAAKRKQPQRRRPIKPNKTNEGLISVAVALCFRK